MSGRRAVAAFAVLALAAAGGYALWSRRAQASKDGAEELRTVTVKAGPIEDVIQATGEVSPQNRVEIKPPIQGRIESLLADEGDRLKTGQIIGWMSSTDRAAILDAARAKGPAELKHWEDAYKPTPLVSPLTGVVILRNVVVGETVDPGDVLYALSDKLIVLAHVDEVDIGRIKPGMSARVTLDAYPDQSVEAKVFNILFEGKNVSNVISYGVKLEAAKMPPSFRSQMTANVDFYVSRKDQALLIPASAVRTSADGGKEVLVPGPGGERVPRKVKLGVESGASVEVLSGLAEGDPVLVVSKKYTPQSAQASSPLVFGGGRPAGASGQAGGQGRAGGGGSGRRGN